MSGSAIAIICGVLSIACSLHVLIISGKRGREALLCRFVPAAYIYQWSLWDECDGEPMNGAADEIMRREHQRSDL